MWKSQVGSNVVAATADADDWETEADYEVGKRKHINNSHTCSFQQCQFHLCNI